eukprot:TRINITY_DN66341_c0_g1_i1.p1 TRINITY_DN66341_c0_g1~~TRINITY_DN66341_c0_g1_i1.p1  ORF type:complete len:390 (+),score=116.67 TRINITY_DN66341_c0_g1_i1:92-1261(+)
MTLLSPRDRMPPVAAALQEAAQCSRSAQYMQAELPTESDAVLAAECTRVTAALRDLLDEVFNGALAHHAHTVGSVLTLHERDFLTCSRSAGHDRVKRALVSLPVLFGDPVLDVALAAHACELLCAFHARLQDTQPPRRGAGSAAWDRHLLLLCSDVCELTLAFAVRGEAYREVPYAATEAFLKYGEGLGKGDLPQWWILAAVAERLRRQGCLDHEQLSATLRAAVAEGGPARRRAETFTNNLARFRRFNDLKLGGHSVPLEDARPGLAVALLPQRVAEQGGKERYAAVVVHADAVQVLLHWEPPSEEGGAGPPLELADGEFPRTSSESVEWWAEGADPTSPEEVTLRVHAQVLAAAMAAEQRRAASPLASCRPGVASPLQLRAASSKPA